jgi:hypothetical protein
LHQNCHHGAGNTIVVALPLLSGRWQRKRIRIAVVSPSLSQHQHHITSNIALPSHFRGRHITGDANRIALPLCHRTWCGAASPSCYCHIAVAVAVDVAIAAPTTQSASRCCCVPIIVVALANTVIKQSLS